MESASRFRDSVECRRDVRGARDVEAQGLHIADGTQGREILVFARRGVDEIAVSGEQFGDLATDAAARTGDQYSLGDLGFVRHRLRERRGRDQRKQDCNEQTHRDRLGAEQMRRV
jgi:hypothetical protein